MGEFATQIAYYRFSTQRLATGKLNQNFDPTPTSLSTQISPSIAYISCLLTASPMPVPSIPENTLSKRSNGENDWIKSFSSIPKPASKMETIKLLCFIKDSFTYEERKREIF